MPRLKVLVLSALAASALAIVPVTPTSADGVTPLATCYATSCHGKDATATGCNADAVTKRSATSPDNVIVELRYSAACRSAWGRIRNGIPGDRVRVQREDGANFAATISTGSDVHTLMVNDAGFVSKACVREFITNELACTGSY